ncbi:MULTISPECIES: hypothetical protein [Natrialba]|uniref:Uncharacterized protein n=3 Tax=Natrialba TaxID=63742 RepID=M0AZX8_NATA1|nr:MULTISPECIES: hypothetical protein [Natrialba]ELY94548.1 hypothetical protein C484_06227 [Natrialba taiwanensis DSM 12281]ELZ03872.1 hypothetical protein C481_04818 [Natrialba asiatica DSM 12278]ELZ04122.1 hypothetical protein C480_11436 [Natrialba aegyptia DSM 13077]
MTATETEGGRYETVVRQDGLFEIRDRDEANCWIATDAPAELER